MQVSTVVCLGSLTFCYTLLRHWVIDGFTIEVHDVLQSTTYVRNLKKVRDPWTSAFDSICCNVWILI
jgi:hypothetical protein